MSAYALSARRKAILNEAGGARIRRKGCTLHEVRVERGDRGRGGRECEDERVDDDHDENSAPIESPMPLTEAAGPS